MEEFLAKQLLQSGLGAVGVLALVYVIRELSRLQTFVEAEFAEMRAAMGALSEKVNLLDKKDAVLEERLRSFRGKPATKHGGNGD